MGTCSCCVSGNEKVLPLTSGGGRGGERDASLLFQMLLKTRICNKKQGENAKTPKANLEKNITLRSCHFDVVVVAVSHVVK